MRAPVAPIGWPSAIAPPWTLTFAVSSARSRAHAMTWAAKASFNSMRSMSASSSCVFASSARIAGTGPIPIPRRVDPGGCPGDDPRERRDAGLLHLLGAPEYDRRRAVGDSRRVARVNGAALLEHRGQLRDRLGRRVGAGMLVALDLDSPLLPRHGDRRDLVGKESGPESLGRAPLRLDRVRILLDAQDSVLPREVLRRLPHELAAQGAEEAVAIHSVHDLGMAHPHAEPRARQQIRRGRHALGPAGEDDLVLAGRDGERAERDRLQGRRAGLVHRERRDRIGHSRTVRDLPGRVGAAACLSRVPEDRLIHGRRGEPRAFEGRSGRRLPQLCGAHRGEHPAELSDRRPRRRQYEYRPQAANSSRIPYPASRFSTSPSKSPADAP